MNIPFVPTIKTENFLLAIAALIELCMAALGVFIGIALIQNGYQGANAQGLILYIPAIVFFVIAAVELTRVPLIISIYRGNALWWKFVGSFFLILIMVITFESMLIGLQTNNMFALSEVTNQDIEISKFEKSLELKEKELIDLNQLDEDTIQLRYVEDLKVIQSNTESRREPLQQKLKDKLEKADTGELEILNENLLQNKKSLENLDSEKQNEIDRIDNERDNDILRITTFYENEEEKLTTLIKASKNERARLQQSLKSLKKGFLGADTKDRKEVKTQIAKTIADEKSYTTELLSLPKKEKNDRLLNKKEHATDIESLNAKIDKKEKELKSIIKGIQADILSLKQTSQLGIQDDIRRIQDKIEEVNNDNDKQIGDAKIKRDKSIEKLGQQNDLISHTRTKIEEFQNEIARIKADKSNITKSNIVYSLATHLTFIEACEGAENPGDVTPKCRKITENFWFGIISFIVAVAGTAVAMGSEVLRTAHLRTNKQKPMRYMFAKILKGVTRPRIKIIEKPVEKIVEVTKVVPEDKVIFKEVPKIHEVIKKEIEYIPVPTTREELINKKNNKKDTK